VTDVERLESARRQLGLSFHDLWVRYIGVGGHRNASSLRSYLNGTGSLDDHDHDQIVLSLNEAFGDAGFKHPIAYRLT